MTHNLAASALLVLVLGTSQGASATRDDKPRAAGIDRSSEVARKVFDGSKFWWKHRSTVEDPTLDIGFLARLRAPLRAVLRFLGKVLESIFDLLRWLIPTSGLGFGVGGGVAGGLLWALCALALAIISWIVYRWLRAGRLATQALAADPIQEPEQLPDALVLMARAKAALEGGDTPEALRLVFQAILAGLVDRGMVRYDPARTNSEYLRDLRPQPGLAESFRRVATLFDRAFYGRMRPERSDVERAYEFCQSLIALQAGPT